MKELFTHVQHLIRDQVIEECAKEIEASGDWSASPEEAGCARHFASVVRDLKFYRYLEDKAQTDGGNRP